MSIPVQPCCSRVFDDRVDLFARSADGVPMTLRLSVAGANMLALQLVAAAGAERAASIGLPATLDHPPAIGEAAGVRVIHPAVPPLTLDTEVTA